MSINHVVIIVNPMVVFYLENLLDLVVEKNHKVVIIEFYKNSIINETITNKLKDNYSDRFHFFKFEHKGNLFKYIFLLYRAFKVLVNIVSLESTKYYIAQPNHILTNYVYFELSNRNFTSVNLIPDGVANYYEVPVSSYLKLMYFKKVLSMFLGYSYKIYKDDYFGVSEGFYSKYYYIALKYSGIPYHFQQIELKPTKCRSNPNPSRFGKVILLGFDVSKKNEDKYMSVLDKTFNNIKNTEKIIYYRPHPRENVTKELISVLKKNNIFITSRSGVAEDFIGEFEKCYGFYSSVLINTRYRYGDTVEVCCVDGDFILDFMPFMNLKERLKLQEIMKSLGIIFLNL